MRYYLDFQGTCFDTAAFKDYDAGRAPGPYAPGELSRFLYPDAASFLREKENAVTIITRDTEEAAGPVTKSALYGIPRMSVMYTEGKPKGEFLAPHTHLHADALLADDSVAELETLAATCPGIVLYEVRRDGAEGGGRWPSIRTLSDIG